jgi:uncharacterized protein YkwD
LQNNFLSAMVALLPMIDTLLAALFFPKFNKPAPPPVPVIAKTAPSPSPSANLPGLSPSPSATPSPSPSIKPPQILSVSPSPSATPASKISAESVSNALNAYRGKNGAGNLSIDPTLQSYAQSRANYLKSIGKLDKHAGHQAFMQEDGFSKLGFNAVAENQSYNYKGDARGLIEDFYGKSAGHNKNQLNPEYTHVGIGINGPFTNIVFGGRKS